MTPHPFALVAALATAAAVHAVVDTAQRNETFAPKPGEKAEIAKERAPLEGARSAGDEKIEFVTVPLTAKEARLPGVRPKEKAPLEMKARAVPAGKPGPSPISTGNTAPSKFEKKSEARMAIRFQESMDEANRVKSSKLKPEKKRTVLERINRFVFRRNEPAPESTPAGGEAEPKKSGSGSP